MGTTPPSHACRSTVATETVAVCPSMKPTPFRRSRSSFVTTIRTSERRRGTRSVPIPRAAASTISTSASRASCPVVRGSATIRSSRARSSALTKRGPPRRGEVATSTAPETIAADSGSSSPTIRVMPSACGNNRRYLRSRRSCSRAATPAASSSSRSSRARLASNSRVSDAASSTRVQAASARASADTESLGSPSPARMASTASLEMMPSATARIAGASHAGVVGSSAIPRSLSPSRPPISSATIAPTRTSLRDACPLIPVSRCTSASGVRAPRFWASPL